MPALNLRENVRRAFNAVSMESSTKKVIYAWMQFFGGSSLAAYTYENPKYENLFYVGSAIAVIGAKDYLKFMRRNASFLFPFESHRKRSSWEFASGMCSYLAGVYAISECFQHKIMWIPCFALIASGYYFATSSINSFKMDRLLDTRPLLKCCQLMFEPALTASATAYVFYFKNRSEGRLKYLPFIFTAITGFKLARRGSFKSGYKYDRNLLLPKATEMCVGGCLVCISCAALAIYSATEGFFWLLTSAFLGFWSFIGVCITFGSLSCLSEKVSQQVFYTYCQRVFGPIVAVDSSILSAYIAYKVGWRYSLLTVPFALAGIYATYRGFKKDIRISML